MIKLQNVPKISVNIYFLEISEMFLGLKNDLESAMVNEPSVFELLRLDCRFSRFKHLQFVLHHEVNLRGDPIKDS